MSRLVLIFSKDRALQLDATLRSFLLHCRDAELTLMRVLFTSSTSIHAEQYEKLEKEYHQHAFLEFIRESDFRGDLLALLVLADYVLFLVDDNIFIGDFYLSQVIESLQENPDSLGFSLRLGRNTTYCYPVDKGQSLPQFQTAGGGILKYNWTDADLDFAYPLEVSSSVYRTEDLLPFLAVLPFKNPNTLEGLMNFNKAVFKRDRPSLLCFEQSVTFCAPLNIVQTDWANRASSEAEHSPGSLARLFNKGYSIDISAYGNFLPDACHQEVKLNLLAPAKKTRRGKNRRKKPKVSVIIPCYNQAQYLPEAVDSVVNQTFQDWECIIVNDGSPDNTSEVAQGLIEKHPDKKIVLIEKENGGLADARNFGIRNSTGEYILPLDSDDKIHPEMLQKTVAVLEDHPAISIAYTHLVYFKEKTDESKIVKCPEYDLRGLCIFNRFSYCSLYRREVWEAVGGYNTNMIWGYEDWDFWLGCFEKEFYPKNVPEPLFFYRLKASSMATEAVKHDAELKARIILNHPTLFTDLQSKWAKGVLNNEPWALAVEHTPRTIPDLEDLIDPNTPIEVMAFIRQADTFLAKNDRASAREAIKQALTTADPDDRMVRILCNMLSRFGDPQAANEFLMAKGKNH